MAALNRPTEATYTTHEEVTVDTEDREDHTFCGIMFPVKCKALLPLDHVVIHSVAVRGRLGPITVWVSKEEESQQRGFRMNPRFWEKIYERTHSPSFQEYQELDLRANPIKLTPGQTRAIYVHSSLPGDEAIVYDNQRSRRTYDDSILSILTGRAHVSTRPFGTSPIWGWGNPWRDHREFVGRVEYGAVYRLWNPNEFCNFGSKFQRVSQILFLMQRRWESPFSRLPDECIFYILNMCRWDWFADTGSGMKAMRKKQKKRAEALALQALEQQQQQDVEMSQAAESVARRPEASSDGEEEEGAVSCCHRRSRDEQSDASSDDDDGEEYHAARDEEASDYAEDEDFEEEWEEDEEDEEEDDDEDWDSDDAYRANHEVFQVQDDDSDDDEADESDSAPYRGRGAWIHRQFARIHVLQALAALDDNGVEEMNH